MKSRKKFKAEQRFEIYTYISHPTGKVDFGKRCILLAYLVWFFLSSCNRISLFYWIWLEPLMSSSTTFSHKHPMLLNFWQGKVNYKDIYSRTKIEAVDVLYHRVNKKSGSYRLILCESQSVYMSVCVFLFLSPPLFLCLQL